MDGFFLIDKEAGWTSFDVCAKLRGRLGARKVGHTGTLDRFATGLLIVAVGKCTKLIPHLEKARKTYRARLLLGKTSETLDPTSEVRDVAFGGPVPTLEDIRRVLDERFSGRIEQVPPKYSALKVAGRRMSDLARAGREFEVESRPTEVFDSEILAYSFPELLVVLEVTAGFYVRSFARDLGAMVAGGGLCLELRRTAIGDIPVEEAVKADDATQPMDAEELFRRLPSPAVAWDRVRKLKE
jgi:tRNA pseudouridine55 synthase